MAFIRTQDVHVNSLRALRWFREKALPGKISQNKMADFLLSNRSSIQRLESGKKKPTSDDLAAWKPILLQEAKLQHVSEEYAQLAVNYACYGGEEPPPWNEWRNKKASVEPKGTTEAVASESSPTESQEPLKPETHADTWQAWLSRECKEIFDLTGQQDILGLTPLELAGHLEGFASNEFAKVDGILARITELGQDILQRVDEDMASDSKRLQQLEQELSALVGRSKEFTIQNPTSHSEIVAREAEKRRFTEEIQQNHWSKQETESHKRDLAIEREKWQVTKDSLQITRFRLRAENGVFCITDNPTQFVTPERLGQVGDLLSESQEALNQCLHILELSREKVRHTEDLIKRTRGKDERLSQLLQEVSTGKFMPLDPDEPTLRQQISDCRRELRVLIESQKQATHLQENAALAVEIWKTKSLELGDLQVERCSPSHQWNYDLEATRDRGGQLVGMGEEANRKLRDSIAKGASPSPETLSALRRLKDQLASLFGLSLEYSDPAQIAKFCGLIQSWVPFVAEGDLQEFQDLCFYFADLLSLKDLCVDLDSRHKSLTQAIERLNVYHLGSTLLSQGRIEEVQQELDETESLLVANRTARESCAIFLYESLGRPENWQAWATASKS